MTIKSIQDKTVLITGANRGIGKAYALAFLNAGAKRIYVAARNPESLKELVNTDPQKLIPLQLDVTLPAHIDAAAKQAEDVEVLVNNAGVLFTDTVLDTDIEKARQQMEVNYIGPLALTKAFAPILKANGGGMVITVSSIAGKVSFPGIITYSASKFAAEALIHGFRTDLAAQGTRVIGVYPGPIDTDMTKEMPFDNKSSAACVAEETLKVIAEGGEDVLPDAMAKDLYAGLRQDPQALYQQLRLPALQPA
ncbi:MAG: SDR family oxidoreductase [Vampirovibrio sp.]|nr:SDR family oxidoreductase [Vampirovibrio sp.]